MKRARWVVLVLVAGAIACELGLRVYANLTHQERGLVYDFELGWRMVPGVEKIGRFWSGAHPARINSHGWRDDEADFENTGGKRRMVVVGDSFTFGVGVDAGERFTEVLETIVPDLEVINLGMNAVGTDQELLVLEKEGLRYGPALVLCQVFENDFTDVGYVRNGYLPKPWFRLEGQTLIEVPPVRTWDVTLRELGYLGELVFRLVQRRTPYRVEAPEWQEQDTTPLVAALLLRMNASAARAGARFIVLLVRVQGRGRRAEVLLPVLRAAGIPVIDTAPRIEDPAERARFYLPDGHWSPAGHRVAAEMVKERMSELGL